MFDKLKQIWKILFPPKQHPQEIPKRKEYSMDELVQRGEELKKYYHQQQHTEQEIMKVCPSCRSSVEQLHRCSKCGKIGCEDCLTFDPMERKYFCEQCWYN